MLPVPYIVYSEIVIDTIKPKRSLYLITESWLAHKTVFDTTPGAYWTEADEMLMIIREKPEMTFLSTRIKPKTHLKRFQHNSKKYYSGQVLQQPLYLVLQR